MSTVPRLLLPAMLTALFLAAASAAYATPTHLPAASRRVTSPAAHKTNGSLGYQTTNPVALSLRLAERYWHGVPTCGTPTVVMSSEELPQSEYERVTSPEPKNSVFEMWTQLQTCTITINASIWPEWRQDDELFQWFCDAMTHEVGHLFGHLDGGQTNAASITYPFLSATSPNYDSVPECRGVALRYGEDEIRNEEVIRRSR